MNVFQFEAKHEAQWQELEELLKLADSKQVLNGERLAKLYRQVCEHLALAQTRAYPLMLIERLESLASRAHGLIYKRYEYGWHRLLRLIFQDFPVAAYRHRWYVLISALLFLVPLLWIMWIAWHDPGFALHFMSAQRMREFQAMYSNEAHQLGRLREADTDWVMFGYYIKNNVSIALQCFGTGMLFGLGSLLVIVSNGLQIGATAGLLIASGEGHNFFPFTVTHGAFELTAIVLSGAAGLRLGHALIVPGRYTRAEALRHAASQAVVMMYGVMGMLVIAAWMEAFWSSSTVLPPWVKYVVGGMCWVVVLIYFVLLKPKKNH